MKHVVLALLAAAMLCGVSTASAQFVFCKIEGQRQGIIKGDNTTKGFEDTIPVLSLSSGVQIPIDLGTGQATGKRQHQPLTIVKNLDKASPKLFLATVTNEILKQVDCVFYHNTAAGVSHGYFRILLTNGRIVESDISGNGLVNHGVRETLRIAFEKITLEDLIGGAIAEDDWNALQ